MMEQPFSHVGILQLLFRDLTAVRAEMYQP
jgi:hypothetical protein